MKMQRFWVGRALLLAVAVLYAGGYVRAQEAKDTLTLTLDRALEIAFATIPSQEDGDEDDFYRAKKSELPTAFAAQSQEAYP